MAKLWRLKKALFSLLLASLFSLGASVALAEVIYSHTPTTDVAGVALATAANTYIGMMLEITSPVNIESVTFKSAATSTANSITWLVQNENGNINSTWTTSNLNISNDGEYTGTPSSTISLPAGYYFFGMHLNSGTDPKMLIQNSGTYPAPNCFFAIHIVGLTFNTSSCVSSSDVYFKLNGTGASAITITSPENGTSTADFGLFSGTYVISSSSASFVGGSYLQYITVRYGNSTSTMTNEETEVSTLHGADQPGDTIDWVVQKTGQLNVGTVYAQAILSNFTTEVASSSIISFTLTTTGNPYFPTFTSTSTLSDLYTTCDPADGFFANSMCKLFQVAFIPSSSSLARFENIKTALESKPPFGYFLSISDALGSFSSSSTSTIDLAAINSLSTVFEPAKTLIGWVAWLLFGFWVYNKFRHFQP